MQKLRLIINADDLGMSFPVNAAIFHLMKEGQVTSASLLANGPAVEEAAARINEFPMCSFGVHLNLTEFQPLTNNQALAPILDKSGCFAGEQKLCNLHIGFALRNAIYSEWLAQVERLAKLGVELTHIDSHNHVHTRLVLFQVLKRIQKASGIRRVRLNMRSSGLERMLWDLALRYLYRTSTTTTATDLRFLIKTSGSTIKGCRTVEVSVHPGNPDYESETMILEENWHGRLPFHVELISYNDLMVPRDAGRS